ncbi:MAG: type II toxin-antitoxin system Phd/YefM family antitoxin [Gammaproteobacteria bacterium]|nr:type II toxin-antitoxin system Phd/YefM family antitoxin [Gammaproteobacteria bacterium]
MIISATELSRHSGSYVVKAMQEPIVIERSGKSTAVLVDYNYFVKLEDAYWGEKAIEVENEPCLNNEESLKFLESIRNG